MLLIARPEPWLVGWNHAALEFLFRLLPFTWMRITFAEFLTYNPLGGTWIFAAVFYYYWQIEDEKTTRRREFLLENVTACLVAMLLTLLLRPWVSWPSPIRVPAFKDLYPLYLGTQGSANCFPSHSTLIYFIVALGFAPLNRKISALLGIFALAALSFPRLYLGGHYPVDILASVLLAVIVSRLVRCWFAKKKMTSALAWATTYGRATQVLLFFWLFELGEGFRATRDIYLTLLRVGRHLTG